MAIPGLSTKLIKWTEEETAHRRALEIRSFEEVQKLRVRGQYFGLAAAFVGLIVSGVIGTFAAVYNSPAAAVTASIIAIVSVGGPFAARLFAKSWNEKSNGEKTAEQ